LEIKFCFLHRWSSTSILRFYFSAIFGVTGAFHYTQLFSIELKSCELFCLGWPGTIILPMSAP
jgi:hypothetical protein